MLLVAQPKSSSSSLRDALNGILKGSYRSLDRYWFRQPYHPVWGRFKFPYGGWIWNKDDLTEVISAPVVYRLHIVPVPANRKLFRSLKARVIVLLRDPADSTAAHERWRAYRNKRPSSERFLFRLETFFGVFNYEWQALAQELGYHLISYSDLMADAEGTVNGCLKYLGKKQRVPEGWELPWTYYSHRRKRRK